MARMIDQIRAGGKLAAPWFVAPNYAHTWRTHTGKIVDLLKDPAMPVLVIDNVSEYYYQGTDQEFWDLTRDFPNLAPPYERMWFESRMQRKIHSKECGDTDVTDIVGKEARVGVFIQAVDPANARMEDTGMPPDLEDLEIRAKAKWFLWCELFINYDLGMDREHGVIAQGSHGSIFMAVDEHGAIVRRPWIQSYLPSDADQTVAEPLKGLMNWLHPAFLAISFLHCKNVRMEDHAMDKPLAKKFRLKHNCEPVKWKTLVIEPLREILRGEGRSGQVGLAKAMHICRGHFRDYREGAGLFGKYHQVVWHPSIVRGSKGKGD